MDDHHHRMSAQMKAGVEISTHYVIKSRKNRKRSDIKLSSRLFSKISTET